ncbi:MAG: hypothetical protein FJX65_19455 [Alphaproteobacteria bacterium]|nr:hypothetical protein [Alphaproteobacteria bacterium]
MTAFRILKRRRVANLYSKAADLELVTTGFAGYLRAWETGFWPEGAIMDFDLAAALAAVRVDRSD